MDTADELLAAELMFNGTFNSLDPHQLVALVSCLVPVDKSNVSPLGCARGPEPGAGGWAGQPLVRSGSFGEVIALLLASLLRL